MKYAFPSLTLTALALAFTSGCQHCPPQPPPPTTATATATAPVTAVAEQRAPIRINAGGSAVTDATGVVWRDDTGFTGGDIIERPDLPIANTKQPEIYRSEHYAMESFATKLPNGRYTVKLHFCETYEGISGPGDRVFTFAVEGAVYKDFDVWAKAGGALRAYIETVPVDITDGELNIKFTSQAENPQINGIEIIPAR